MHVVRKAVATVQAFCHMHVHTKSCWLNIV